MHCSSFSVLLYILRNKQCHSDSCSCMMSSVVSFSCVPNNVEYLKKELVSYKNSTKEVTEHSEVILRPLSHDAGRD